MKQERADPGWAWTGKLNISGYGEFGRARTEAFPAGVPASAAYATPALIKRELLVEVEAIAVIGSGA